MEPHRDHDISSAQQHWRTLPLKSVLSFTITLAINEGGNNALLKDN